MYYVLIGIRHRDGGNDIIAVGQDMFEMHFAWTLYLLTIAYYNIRYGEPVSDDSIAYRYVYVRNYTDGRQWTVIKDGVLYIG